MFIEGFKMMIIIGIVFISFLWLLSVNVEDRLNNKLHRFLFSPNLWTFGVAMKNKKKHIYEPVEFKFTSL